MADWKSRGYVEDSEDTEADEEEGIIGDDKVDDGKRGRVGSDGSIQFGEEPQRFYSIDDFVGGDTTDRSSPVRFVERNASTSSAAPEHRVTSPTGFESSSGVPLGGGLGSAILSQYESAVADHGAPLGLQLEPPAERLERVSVLSKELGSDLPVDHLPSSSLPDYNSSATEEALPRSSTSPQEGQETTPSHVRPAVSLLSSPRRPDAAEPPSTAPSDTIQTMVGGLTRNLRKRNPIQLHPYLLEGERYRQSLKARGLKPLKINPGQGSPVNHPQPPVEGESDFEPEAETQPADDVFALPPSSPPALAGSSQGDFPDVDVLLHRSTPGVVNEGFKRRRVATDSVERPRAYSPIQYSPLKARAARNRRSRPVPTRRTTSTAEDALPPSPPPTSSREQGNVNAPDNDEPDSLPGNASADTISHAESHSRPGARVLELSEDSESDVAPLAWQTPSSRLGIQQRRRSNPENGMERWLAYSGDPYEVEEDNRINMMLPPRARPNLPYSRRRQRERQQKVTEYVRPADQPSSGQRYGSATAQARPSISGRPAGNADRKRKPHSKTTGTSDPRLSIVDATRYSSSNLPVPNFVRLAHRRARARQDLGRHSPGRKIFRLATRQDTEEVQTVLQDWAGGLLSPLAHGREVTSSRKDERPPLTEVPGNGESHSGDTKEKQASRGPATGPRSTSMRKAHLDGSLSHESSERLSSHYAASARTPNTSKPRSTGTKLHSRPRPTAYLSPWQGVTSTLRPAQLESTVTRYRDGRRRSRPNFELKLAEINLQYQQRMLEDPKSAKVQLSRFLSQDQAVASSERREDRAAAHDRETAEQEPQTAPTPKTIPARRLRKRPPRHLDAQAAEFRQPPPEAAAPSHEAAAEPPRTEDPELTLRGLSALSSDYTISFGIVPLDLGTYFHESTFIGAGGLASALEADYSQESRHATGQTTVITSSDRFQWSVWNETVSSELGKVIDWSCDTINHMQNDSERATAAIKLQEIAPTLRSITRYFSESLNFSDAVDRRSFVQRSCHLFLELLETLRGSWAWLISDGLDNRQRQKCLVQMSTMVLILAHQVCRIARHESERSNLATAEQLVKSVSVQLVRCLIPANLASIRSFYASNQQQSTREAGIRDQGFLLEAVIVAMHVLGQLELPGVTFWELANAELGASTIDSAADVPSFERIWENLFTLLPLQEFDERGVLKVGRRFQASLDNWLLPKKLASRLFKIYQSQPGSQSPRFNPYCRIVLIRCYHLLSDWGWRRCDKIVGTLFDFFASNNLAHLRHEESYGSVRFLEELDRVPDLGINPRDRCFHIFLKFVAAGLKRLSRHSPQSKVRNVVFRLIPNHGRQYPKGQPIRQEELDSLRNHHDLLCTLYWASPASCRPSINILRDLIDAETSHPDACQVNIRAWLNLVRFQLSSDEPAATLKPFGAWHGVLTSKLLKQHELAKVEAEANYATTHSNTSAGLASELLKPAIRANQQAIEVIISDALQSTKNAIEWSRYVEATIALLDKSSTADVFGLFEMRKRGTDKLVIQSLQVVKEFVQKCSELSKVHASQQTSEESQEYGDWSAVVEAATISPLKDAAEHLQTTVHDALARLVSNAFGADTPPEDFMLQEIVDAWVLTAQLLVNTSLRQWDDFLGAYSRHSWMMLRNTEQTRKYTAYFMAKVIEADAASYQAQRFLIMTHWVTCLVERESILKFQHTFTSTLLNTNPADPLLKNLPFTFRARDGVYSITLTEFSERRLSLISSVLTNMREFIENLSGSQETESAERREECAQLLKRLMATMKDNYQEVQQGTAVSGAYVEFVQTVVGFLQQYTVDICPVDRFFTDSAAFPLPARDPTYVVGRLKNYGLKLSAVPAHKQLASFVQSVSVRAAMDDQQSYLSVQLGDAMVTTFEDSEETRPTLRAFLLQAVFPAYIEHAFNTSAGWILARPVLQASTRVFDELLQNFDATNNASVASVAGIMDNFLDVSMQAMKPCLENRRFMERPSVLHVLMLFTHAITASLVPLDYVYRSSRQAGHARRCTAFFHAAFTTLAKHVSPTNSADLIDPPSETYPELPAMNASQQPFSTIRRFCAQELHETLTRNWTKHDDQYYFVRGNMRKHVMVRHLSSLEGERTSLLDAIERFQELFWRMDALCSQIDEGHGGGAYRRRGRGTGATMLRLDLL